MRIQERISAGPSQPISTFELLCRSSIMEVNKDYCPRIKRTQTDLRSIKLSPYPAALFPAQDGNPRRKATNWFIPHQ